MHGPCARPGTLSRGGRGRWRERARPLCAGQSRAISHQPPLGSALRSPHGKGPDRTLPAHKASDSGGSSEGSGAQPEERKPPCWVTRTASTRACHMRPVLGVIWGGEGRSDPPRTPVGAPSPPPAPHCLHEGCSAGQKSQSLGGSRAREGGEQPNS